MTVWKWIMICAACLVVGALAAGIGTWVYFTKHPTIQVKLTEGKTVYGPMPKDYKNCIGCWKSPLELEARQEGDKVFLHAYDACKSTEATLKISATAKNKPHEISLMPMIGLRWDREYNKFDFGYGGSILYSYNFGLASLGIGPGYMHYPTASEFLISGKIS